MDRSINPAMIARIASRYPPAQAITPQEFEHFVMEVFRAAGEEDKSLTAELHPVVVAADGNYDFDGLVTFEKLGMKFVVVVEAKRHRDPIKRSDVQILHSKMLSVGAQKGILVSASPFQSGAVEFALAHGIALALISEGRLMVEARSNSPVPPMTPERAREFGIEDFAAMTAALDPVSGKVRGFRLSPRNPESLNEWMAK